LIDGDPYSDEYQKKFIVAVVSLLKDQNKRSLMGAAARERIFKEFGWNQIAKDWEIELKRMLA